MGEKYIRVELTTHLMVPVNGDVESTMNEILRNCRVCNIPGNYVEGQEITGWDHIKIKEVIQVGSRIRSWDHQPFEGRPDMYVEGPVTKIENGYYFMEVEKDTCFPENPRTEVRTCIPEDIHYLHEWENRIELLER